MRAIKSFDDFDTAESTGYCSDRNRSFDTDELDTTLSRALYEDKLPIMRDLPATLKADRKIVEAEKRPLSISQKY